MQLILLHPHFTEMGGAGNMVLETGKRLAQRGHRVDCICIRADEPIVAAAEGLINFHEIGGPLSSSIRFWLAFRSGCRKVRREFEQIVDSHDETLLIPHVFPANWWAAYLMRRRPELPCAWFCHEPSAFIHSDAWIGALPFPKDVIARLLKPVLRQIDLAACRSFSKVLTNSHHSNRYTMDTYGYPASRCEPVYLAVDHDRFRVGSPASRVPSVVTIAKLTRFKNINRIIEAIAILVRGGRDDLRLEVVGVGDARNELEACAERSGVAEHVCFHGRAADDEVTRLLQRASVFCLASVDEPFGLVVLEALACGTPVVAFDGGGPKEILHSQGCGLLVPDTKPETIATAIGSLLDAGADYDALSCRAVHRAREFTWDATVDRLESVFQQELERGRNGRSAESASKT